MQLDALENSSRKRPRSISHGSDSGESSPKRGASEGPSLTSEVGLRSPGTSVEPQPMSNLRIVEDPSDIDAYMATQEATPTAWQDVPPADKLAMYEQFSTTTLELGQSWFIVSTPWLKNFKMACNGEVDKEGPRSETTLGPVDNSPLVEEEGYLRPGLQYGVDYEVVPQRMWDSFVEWYGPPTVTLERKVTTRASSQELFVECYVPIFKVYRLTKTNEEGLSGEGKPHQIQMSLQKSAKEFFLALTEYLSTISSEEFRLWRVSGLEAEYGEGSEYPIGRLRANDGEIFHVAEDDKEKTLGELLVNPNDEFVFEFKENGSWPSESPVVSKKRAGNAALTALTTISAQLSKAPTLFNSGSYLDELSSRLGNTPSSSKGESSSSSLLQPAPTILRTRSKSPQPARVPGTLGLGNLGNTCFMNSALQCLAHNEELTNYFLTELYTEELNRDNPLGMGGAIAEIFGALLSKIWSPNGGPSSFAPREFKGQLQRFAPQFSGYQQHDSQELVAFLLDGLHEDLNRVIKKPYVENPDWEGGGEKELVKLARTSWDGYKSRNDSVIVDLFQGQYKSTLVCPECQKVSITFDPFMYLTLPLPIKKKWRHDIYFVPWDTEKPHLKIPLEIDNDSSFRDVRKLLGRWIGANPDHLIVLELFQCRFYKYFDDHTSVSDISAGDHIVCYELPSKPAIHIKDKKLSEDGNLILPVFNMRDKPATTYSSSPDLFGLPFFVALDPGDTQSMDAIYAAVVGRLQRWTKNASNLYKYSGVPHVAEPEVVPVMDGKENASITEIRENGDIVDIPDSEGADIADEKPAEGSEDDMDIDMVEVDSMPVIIGPQQEIFQMKIVHTDSTKSALDNVQYQINKQSVAWEDRRKKGGPLVVPGDALLIKWDDQMESFYLRTEALWNKYDFEEFIHPELAAARQQGEKKENITIEDCLDEFTKEEQLGEDDLWYCPKCKKHQQATKNLQLWKVPDVLVVHLKRFSNSRIIRDKIDAFVDFPLEGLDLENRVGEKQSSKVLLEQGLDLAELGLGDVDEPLLYDLFAVDEHLGGLGGGHYRAYARNHTDGEWYHFDDSHVSKCKPEDAINRNAYLLFYRRRTTRPIGGKTHAKIQAVLQSNSQRASTAMPTPPDESTALPVEPNGFIGPVHPQSSPWPSTSSDEQSSLSSLPPLEEEDPDNGPPGLEGGYSFPEFAMPGAFNGYQGRSGSPASVSSSNKADGGSDGRASPQIWAGESFSELGSSSSSPYPPKGSLKPATFDPPPSYDEDASWESIEPMQEPPSPLSRTISESGAIDPWLLGQSSLSPPQTKLRTVQLPSPEPEETAS
ncbi:hypothetical protein M422DRAFT_57819 [Sphaerobolus stellatus SS14]|nr:hypothetical protein M422DRAFT_57819 [Sphaerobolus stellatus SS14]